MAAVANQKPWTDFGVEGQVSGVKTQGRETGKDPSLLQQSVTDKLGAITRRKKKEGGNANSNEEVK